MRFFSLIFFSCLAMPALAEDFSLNAMLEQVSKGLSRSDTMIGQDDGLPPLDHVVLKLKVESKVSASGRMSFWIVSVGAKTNASTLTTMSMRLVPSEDKEEQISDNDEIADQLVAAILAGAEVKRTAAVLTPPLAVEDYTVNLAFAVENTGDGGFKLVFPAFSADASASTSSHETQEITIVFQQ